MYKSSRTPTQACQYPVRPTGKGEAFPCGSRNADLVRVVMPTHGKGKAMWAWWCDDHHEFFTRYIARVAK